MFENYVEFFLSESSASEVLLSDAGSSDGKMIIASDVWRVLILNKLVTKDHSGQSVVCHDGSASSRYTLHCFYAAVCFITYLWTIVRLIGVRFVIILSLYLFMSLTTFNPALC